MANETEKKKKGFGRKIKELFGELKRVTWPTFPTVVKQTGVVLMITLLVLLVLMGMDALLGYLYDLLVTGLGSGTESSAAVSAVAGSLGAVFRL